MEKTLYRIRVTGRVQGVGYRNSARNTARFLGLMGIVKNMKDGSVYIEAEGENNQLIEFINWCHRGPGFGFIENVEVRVSSPKNYADFRIIY